MAPVVVTAWSGTVDNDWYKKAEELLSRISDDFVSYSYKSVGLFGVLKITSKTTSSEFTFKVDAKGKTRGVLRVMAEDTYVFLLFLMALSKVAPFELADEENKTIRISCNPENPLFKNISASAGELDELGTILGITIPDKKRYVPGATAFF